MDKRDFLKVSGALAVGAMLPAPLWALAKKGRLRTAHIGVGNMGADCR